VTVAWRSWAFEHGTLWASELDADVAPVSPRGAAMFGEVRREAAAALAGAMGLPGHEPALRRFTAGRRCFAAWIDGRIAAYGWASQGRECVGELEREFHMHDDEAHVWDCVTLPEYRGRHMYSALLRFMLDELRDAGVRRVWIGASLDNRPSIKGFTNAGFQPIIKLMYLRLFGLRCSWAAGYSAAPGPLVAAARRLIVGDNEWAFGPLTIGFAWPDAAAESCL
jgi:ribosomal protein S18 acetylase RimI-like enzyme